MDVLKRIVIRILVWEARATLATYKPHVIAITGSVGKTTTKDAIHAAIGTHVYARRSTRSYNGELGVALTILGLESAWRNPIGWILNLFRGLVPLIRTESYPLWLVLEVGADRPGDIARLAPWLRPEIVVITGVSQIPAHVEYFDSPEHVFREKRTLAEHLRAGGTLILNGDDPRMRDLRGEFRGASVLYGIEGENDFTSSHEEILYNGAIPDGMHFRANHAGSSIPVAIHGALGTPRVSAALAALAVAESVGIDLVSAASSLAGWSPPPGRVRLIPGLKGSMIIDDSYNSSPAAALSALDTLVSVKAKRRIAVLGDMLELGKFAKDAHVQLGERAAACADKLITIGIRSRATAAAALDAKLPDDDILQYDLHEVVRAADELQKELREGDVVLVKGSQSIRLERFVLEIMAEPAKAPELLVRMEPEWQFR